MLWRGGVTEHRDRREEHRAGSVDGGGRRGAGQTTGGLWVVVKARGKVWWRSGAGFMLKGCRGCSGDGLPETIGVISRDGHMRSCLFLPKLK